MTIKRINEFPEGSGSLSNDDIFLFMDNPAESGITKKISLSQIGAAIGGGGLSDSDRYIICKAGDDIAAKYAAAKALTPGGSAKSATNRAYLIVMPGVYPLSAQWEIDAEFVDVIGLGSTPLDRGCNVSVTVTGNDINASANNVRIKGIGTRSGSLLIFNNLPLQVFEECQGGDFSFRNSGTASGSFVNCSGGFGSFGGGGVIGGGTASGSFVNCVSGAYSFGGGGTASGSFVNCTGGNFSFGGSGGAASGSFKDCTAGNDSFGSSGGTASGKFLRCTLTTGTFPTLSGTGKYRLCIDGNYDVINADAPPTP